jgi:hypothetical protein
MKAYISSFTYQLKKINNLHYKKIGKKVFKKVLLINIKPKHLKKHFKKGLLYTKVIKRV